MFDSGKSREVPSLPFLSHLSIDLSLSLSFSLSLGQRGNLCAAKATLGAGWTYGGGGGWLSGGGGGEGEGETRGMRCCCDVVYSFHCMCCRSLAGNGAGEMGCCQRQLQDLSSAWTKEAHNNKILPENVATLSSHHETKEKELSLAVEHGMLLREECSIVFTLINRRPTLPPPRPLVFCSDETHAFLYTNMHFFRYIVRRW
uniref:Uncharacterized protein n=1 Tax=Oryza glumipatula TaxID=40148 RepID=A0A0D9Z2S2_9ORYZ